MLITGSASQNSLPWLWIYLFICLLRSKQSILNTFFFRIIVLIIFPSIASDIYFPQLMSSRPDSPIKQTFKKLLSPNKPKPSHQPGLSHQLTEHTNWTYPESTSSSSDYSSSSIESTKYTGWNVIGRPQTLTSGANKENLQVNAKDIVDKVMGPVSPSKLSKQKSKQMSKDSELDRQFEELMVLITPIWLMLTLQELAFHSN